MNKSALAYLPWSALGAVLVAAILLSISFAWFTDTRLQALVAQEDQLICQDLLKKLRSYETSSPSTVAQPSGQEMNLRQRLEEAAQVAGLPTNVIDTIANSDEGRRLSNSPYLVKTAQIMLRQITLAQVIRFFHHLTVPPRSDQPPLRVESLHLTIPHAGDATGDFWRLEAGISYLVYDNR